METTGGAGGAGGAADGRGAGARVLDRLLEGNTRFADGGSTARRPRPDLAREQSPVAVVLTCADSRVAPEIVLDQDLGDLFTVRVAGNAAAAPALLGSVEFPVAVLGTPLLLVLGHEGCAAVATALAAVEGAAPPPGHVAAVAAPALDAARSVAGLPEGERLGAAVREHVRRQVALLSASTPVLAPAVAQSRLLVAGACYSLATGRVELVSPTASP
jgi:carbonic anhydrase